MLLVTAAHCEDSNTSVEFPTCTPSDPYLRVAGTPAKLYIFLSARRHVHRHCLPGERAPSQALSSAGEPPDGLDENRSLAGKIHPPRKRVKMQEMLRGEREVKKEKNKRQSHER